MAYHVASSTTVYGYTYRVMGVEGINIGGLAGLYTKSCSLRTTINTTIHVVEFPIVDTCCCFVTIVKVIVEDVGDLSCLSDILTILLLEMTAFA